MTYLGNPVWYELSTSKGNLGAATKFYTAILNWTIRDAGMEGFSYSLANSDSDMVAGLMEMPDDVAGMPPMWMIYFAADDLDATVAKVRELGGSIHREPAAIPGTGRFAIAADPQGAAFGLLEPDMSQMSDADRAKAERGDGAFNQKKAGHGNWNELMSSDPEAGYEFYSQLFGWTKGEGMDMGEPSGDNPGGTYQLFRHRDVDIGAMMRLGKAPHSSWMPYFGVDGGVSNAIERIKAAGGQVAVGPMEVPGPAYIAVGSDPQGAWFAIVGAER